jgi:hypothetical protein
MSYIIQIRYTRPPSHDQLHASGGIRSHVGGAVAQPCHRTCQQLDRSSRRSSLGSMLLRSGGPETPGFRGQQDIGRTGGRANDRLRRVKGGEGRTRCVFLQALNFGSDQPVWVDDGVLVARNGSKMMRKSARESRSRKPVVIQRGHYAMTTRFLEVMKLVS